MLPRPDDASRGRLVLAGLSVRLMAESARRAGYEVIALDAFGDRDTRQAAAAWHDIGTGQGARLDGARLLAALGGLRRPAEAAGPIGWIAGAGFEALPEVLAQGAALLQLLGTAPPAQAALRDPGRFFAALALLGLPHPATQLQRPEPAQGWLYKDFGSSGGWQVRAAQAAPPAPPPRAYYQQRAPGDPMSCLFIANGRAARVLGHQRQLVAPLGARPCVWHGVLGPVAVPEPVGTLLEQALAALVPRFGLQGLASLDYLLDGSTVRLLECNPRPSASMALYEDAAELPLIDAHVQACLRGELPGVPCPAGSVRGTHLVFAHRATVLDGDTLASLQRSGWCRDLAAAPMRIGRHEPVCTVTAQAQAQDEAEARRLLDARVRWVRDRLEAAATHHHDDNNIITET